MTHYRAAAYIITQPKALDRFILDFVSYAIEALPLDPLDPELKHLHRQIYAARRVS